MVSNQEKLVFDSIKRVFPHVKIKQSHRPNWLKNMDTGNNYEIDLYFPEFNVGIEYQGAIHFEDLERFNNDSDKSRRNDVRKANIIRSARICAVIEVFEVDLTGDVVQNIIDRAMNHFNNDPITSRVRTYLQVFIGFLKARVDLSSIVVQLPNKYRGYLNGFNDNKTPKVEFTVEKMLVKRRSIRPGVNKCETVILVNYNELKVLDNIAFYARKVVRSSDKELKDTYLLKLKEEVDYLHKVYSLKDFSGGKHLRMYGSKVENRRKRI